MRTILELRNNREHLLLGVWLSGSLVLVTALLLPVSGVALRPLPAVGPVYLTAIGIFNGFTALLLLLQFQESRRLALALLGSAYVFASVMPILQLLVTPELGWEGHELTAAAQIPVRMWVFLYLGYPLFIGVSIITTAKRFDQPFGGAEGRKAWNIAAIGIPLLLAAALAVLAALGMGDSRALITGNDYRFLARSPLALAIWILNALVLLALVMKTRLRNRLELWLAVAILGTLVSLGLSLLGSARFTVGWYAGRLIHVLSSGTLLAALLWEVHLLYDVTSRLNRSLRAEAARDALTGVASRRNFDERFPELFRKAEIKRQPLTVIFCDIDHFKAFNDAHGHQAGDGCLVAVAQAMDAELDRKGQFLARYGGEEFIGVLPGLGSGRAWRVGEKIRRAVENLGLPHGGVPGMSVVTVSVGVATQDASSDFRDAGELLSAADRAVYEAKHAGRNQVRTHAAGPRGASFS